MGGCYWVHDHYTREQTVLLDQRVGSKFNKISFTMESIMFGSTHHHSYQSLLFFGCSFFFLFSFFYSQFLMSRLLTRVTKML